MPQLTVLEGPHAGTQLEIGPETTLGRSPTCDLVVDDANVSRRHAQLLLYAGAVTLVDLGSRNGTLLNGEKIAGKVQLKPGDRLQVGPLLAVYEPNPIEIFGKGDGAAKATAVAKLVEATPSPALRQIFLDVTRSTTPAACIRVAVESAVAALGAQSAVALTFGEGESADLSVVVGPLASVPDGFRARLRTGEVVQDQSHLGAPMELFGGKRGAMVVQRKGKPFNASEASLLFDIARLAARTAEGALARQYVAAPAFPLVLWRERPALLSPSFRRCLERTEQAARHQGPLLLVGEAATGRDELALTVHQLSKRAEAPFVAWRLPPIDPLDPARLPPTESIASAIQRAEGGTLYLGVISSWSAALAELWLRELDRFTPSLFTADVRLPLPVRLVASSSDPIAELTAAKRLPAKLLARFDGEHLDVPPLRKRKGDLPLLVERLSAAAGQRLGRSVPKFSAAAMKALADYAWPGNLSELQVCVEWALFACGADSEVQLWDLPPQIRTGEARDRERRQPLGEMIAALERTAIVEALREAGFKKIRAAAALGISRPTLDKKIAEYQIRLKP